MIEQMIVLIGAGFMIGIGVHLAELALKLPLIVSMRVYNRIKIRARQKSNSSAIPVNTVPRHPDPNDPTIIRGVQVDQNGDPV